MKTSLFSTLSAIALTGLGLTLSPATASAKGHSGGHSSGHVRTSCHTKASSHCFKSLPRGCRTVNYGGVRCWYGGGNYYRCSPLGGYVIYRAPVVTKTVVCEPSYVQSYEEEEISYLPTNCTTVYVGGERCWYRNGIYYRHCGKGYKPFHCGTNYRGKVCAPRHSSHPSRGKVCHTTPKGHGTGHNTGHKTAHHSGGHKGKH